jgi:hypothetical protein
VARELETAGRLLGGKPEDQDNDVPAKEFDDANEEEVKGGLEPSLDE